MTLYRGPGGTGSATSDADTTLYQDFLTQTIAARDAALQAEINAELAETNAETAEANAETAETNAAASASAAATSASNAASSASSASSSASAAAASASEAAGYAASINPADLVHISGTETITGAKTFSQTITGSITGNAGTVTNGVYTTGDQTIAGTKTFSSNPILSAGTANGLAFLNGSKVLTTGSALTFDGTNLGIGTSSLSNGVRTVIQGSQTGGAPQTSGTTQTFGLLRLQGTSFTSALDFGTNGGNYAWIQSTDQTNLATNYSLALNPNGGNVGIGTSSPQSKLHVAANNGGIAVSAGAGTQAQLQIAGNGTTLGSTSFDILQGASSEAYVYNRANQPLIFGTNNTERARIDSSGNLLVGTTTSYSARGVFDGGGSFDSLVCYRPGTGYQGQIVFRNPNGAVGVISTSGTSTTYATSSDYRLKDNIAPMTGALAKVALLKPCTYKWKADGSEGEGFIAHELAEVVPQCVTGEKDAVDADGKPVYQGIDTSFLVATLTAAIQEQQAIIQQLQAEVAALKGQA